MYAARQRSFAVPGSSNPLPCLKVRSSPLEAQHIDIIDTYASYIHRSTIGMLSHPHRSVRRTAEAMRLHRPDTGTPQHRKRCARLVNNTFHRSCRRSYCTQGVGCADIHTIISAQRVRPAPALLGVLVTTQLTIAPIQGMDRCCCSTTSQSPYNCIKQQ